MSRQRASSCQGPSGLPEGNGRLQHQTPLTYKEKESGGNGLSSEDIFLTAVAASITRGVKKVAK
jgi:hypothetical protein